ncbi:hypothetical protein Avbf_06189, partial [Armadillidium vulgare]
EKDYFGLIHVKDEIVIKEEPFNFQEEHTPNNKICPLDQNSGIANREVGQNRLPQSSRSSSSSSSYSLRDSNAENPTHSEHNESPESLSGHEETNQQSTKSRKRKKNHLEWRRNLCKKLRNMVRSIKL